jgi:hypothetical protein
MKLRVLDDSLRLRLGVSEVAAIGAGTAVRARTRFPGGATLDCTLAVGDATRITATLAGAAIVVTLPRATATAWAGSDAVSLHGAEPVDGGELAILVEKDFACVTPRAGEDAADRFPNPQAGAC